MITRRTALTAITAVACWLAGPEPAPGQYVSPGAILTGAGKLRYLVRQLDLDSEQQRHAEGLIQLYEAEEEESRNRMVVNVELVRQIYSELSEAENAGDTARVERLRNELKMLGPGAQAEENFYQALSAILSPEQKARLERARARLASNPDGSLRPADVFRLARELNLTDDQHKRLSEVRDRFRKRINEVSVFDESTRRKELEGLIAEVRAVLDPQQQTRFDRELELMRPPPPPATPPAAPPVPATAPAAPAPGPADPRGSSRP